MARYQDPSEKEDAKQALIEAILEDGKGKDYYADFGKYLWEPEERTFGSKWSKGGWTYYMWASDPQVSAYYRDGKTFVAHNGQERSKVQETWGVR